MAGLREKKEPDHCKRPNRWPRMTHDRISGRFTADLNCLPNQEEMGEIHYCKGCGVMLIEPYDIEIGYGKVCAARLRRQQFGEKQDRYSLF